MLGQKGLNTLEIVDNLKDSLSNLFNSESSDSEESSMSDDLRVLANESISSATEECEPCSKGKKMYKQR